MSFSILIFNFYYEWPFEMFPQGIKNLPVPLITTNYFCSSTPQPMNVTLLELYFHICYMNYCSYSPT
jgi:hypothetical protein